MRVAGLAGLAPAAGAVVATLDDGAAGLDVGVQFAGGDLVAAHGEGLGEGHAVQRTLVGLAAGFVVGGAHHIAAGRQHDHLGAVLAVFENVARLGGVGIGADQQQAGDLGWPVEPGGYVHRWSSKRVNACCVSHSDEPGR
ncbi:hypothetical protein D9M71_699990 [compost metagenome]